MHLIESLCLGILVKGTAVWNSDVFENRGCTIDKEYMLLSSHFRNHGRLNITSLIYSKTSCIVTTFLWVLSCDKIYAQLINQWFQ